jgi:hypothetical protein
MAGADDLVKTFRTAAIAKGDFADPPRDGELFARMRASVDALRELGDLGKAAFRALLCDSSPHVRCWAAADLLTRGDPDARRVLQELSALPGLLGFSASTTLREFDAGNLRSPF